MSRLTPRAAKSLIAACFLAAAVGCGNDNGEGAGGSATSQVSGNVASASTVLRDEASRSWLAWIGTEIVGLARRAWAQAPDTGLGGITILVEGNGTPATDVTEEDGAFDVPGAPTGDVLVTLHRGNCSASVSLPAVVGGSIIDLDDVTFTCGNASPGKISESFDAVVLNKPDSPNGNLLVCAGTGDSARTRSVMSRDATFENGSFEDLQEGDLVFVEGERVGQGAPSTLDADNIRIEGVAVANPCDETVTPTPTPTPIVETTPTPTAESPLAD